MKLKNNRGGKHAAPLRLRHVLLPLALVMVLCAVAIAAFFLLRGRAEPAAPTAAPNVSAVPTDTPSAAPEIVTPTPDPSIAAAVALFSYAERLAEEMTLEEKVWQMFFVTPEQLTGEDAVTRAGEATQAAMENRPVGGIIYFAANIKTPEQTREMLANSQSCSKIPCFLGVDEEGGRVARVGRNADMRVPLIPAMATIGATGDADEAYNAAATIGGYLTELGFNVDFAPVADIVTNPKNTEIGDRAFSDDASVAAEMVDAAVRGLRSAGIASVIKHFPGHGSTQTDSHHGYSESTRTLEELRANEFLPFRAGIAADTEFVLVSHMTAINVDEAGTPSTLSRIIITDILRNELGFEGLVITDSMRMGALTDAHTAGEAAVLAVAAGCDMLLMPQDLDAAVRGILDAIATGILSEERINESVVRILHTKLKIGIMSPEN